MFFHIINIRDQGGEQRGYLLRRERRAALDGGRCYGNGKGRRTLFEEFTTLLHFCAEFFTSICYNQGVFRRTECARKTAHPLRRRPIRKRRISPNPPQSLSAGFFVKKTFYNFITSSCGNFYNFVVCCLRKAEEAPMSEKKSVVGGQIRAAGFGRSARRKSEDRDAERQPQDGKDGGRNDARTGENLQAPVLSAAEALIRFRGFFCFGQTSACKPVASRLQFCRKPFAILLRADVLKRGERSCENKAFAVHRSAFFAKIMRADATARRGAERVPRTQKTKEIYKFF